MTLTDQVLADLKDGCLNRIRKPYYPKYLLALILRLEAAENFIGGRTVICGTCDNVIVETETDRVLYKAWLKAAGK